MVSLTRRNFLRAKKLSAKPAIRLPWIIDEQHFIAGCTQCSDCLSACDENIIIKGDGGFPEINFSQGECTFCQKCLQACEQPLFVDPSSQAPWQLDIEIKNNCLANQQVYCQSCQDSCESQAISFQYLASSVPQPRIKLEQCNGCGACVSVCPQSAIELNPMESNILTTEQ